MKLPSRYTLQFRSPVAPLAGAWIEINVFSPDATSSKSLPSRERGLKYCDKCEGCTWRGVAPLAGAWIEIRLTMWARSALMVAPLAGAWIEILLCTKSMGSHWSLPSRERGLKSAIGMKYIKLGLRRSLRGSMSEKGS